MSFYAEVMRRCAREDLEKNAIRVVRLEELLPPPVVEAPSASGNMLRPSTLSEFIGQAKAKRQLQTYIDVSVNQDRVFPHTLLATGPGRGKTTLAMCIAGELDRKAFFEQAPLSLERLAELASEMNRGDILLIDEIHMQAKGDPEDLYHFMEDRRLVTPWGVLTVPEVTVIGCTTDAGLLPQPLIDRFVIDLPIEGYTEQDMCDIAQYNASKLGVTLDVLAEDMLAKASQSTPRKMNNFMKQAEFIAANTGTRVIDDEVASEVLDSSCIEEDGLTFKHIEYLEALFNQRRWVPARKEWVCKASVKTLTYSLGMDVKRVEREIEPILIKSGYVRIAHGRELTEAGLDRIEKELPPDPS